MPNQIDDYVKRPMRYQNIDGLTELLVGFLWIVYPLLEFFSKTAASSSIWHRRATLLVCVVAVTFLFLYGHKVLKKHITYPRTGFVKYRRTGRRAFASLVLAMGVAAAIAIATAFVLRRLEPHSSEMLGAALASAVWALFYVFVTRMDMAWRWVVLVALIVVPPVVATLPLGRLWLGNLPIVLLGLIYFVSGAMTLTLYLRQNKLPEQAAE